MTELMLASGVGEWAVKLAISASAIISIMRLDRVTEMLLPQLQIITALLLRSIITLCNSRLLRSIEPKVVVDDERTLRVVVRAFSPREFIP